VFRRTHSPARHRSAVGHVLLALLLCAAPAGAEAPHDGAGFGVTDSDDYVAAAMGPLFAALEPETFRFIVPYNAVEDRALMARTAERIARARAAGVRDVVVSFGARGGDARETGFHRPPVEEWIERVRSFMDAFDAEVDVWGPANEPNAGVGWLAGAHGDGPRLLAAYYRALEAEVERRGGDDRLLSPEFHDEYDATGAPARGAAEARHGPGLTNLRHYIDHYTRAGGDFGDYVGWHPYAGVRRMSAASTDDLLAATPASVPVWISEVGAIADAPRLGVAIGQAEQDAQVRFIVRELAQRPRVTRVSYWHMIDLTPGWDSALLDSTGAPRPAWHTWCWAAMGRCGELLRGVEPLPWRFP
jgi:hypothetical protein